MAKYRKLGRNSSQRKALLRGQVTALIENGKIVTTEARAKEVKKQAEKLITLAIKEKDNFETVKVSAKVPKKDANGKRVKEVVDGKKVTVPNAATERVGRRTAAKREASPAERASARAQAEVRSRAAGLNDSRAGRCAPLRRFERRAACERAGRKPGGTAEL